MNSSHPWLHRFLAVERWAALGNALETESRICPVPLLNTKAVFAALLVGVAPCVVMTLAGLSPTPRPELPLLATGIAAVVAVWLRWRMKLSYNQVVNWKSALSLTHTAFALGCIPAVAALLIAPQQIIAQRELVQEAFQAAPGARSAFAPLSAISLLLGTSLWAAVTEEIIFRALLVTVLRRWIALKSQLYRNLLAVMVSALLFGIAHIPMWGPVAGIALVGLGVGLGLAYVANGEKLMPLIIYHLGFDLLSIGAALVLL